MLQNRDQLGFSRIVIYASDDTKTLTTVLRKVESRFDIQISKQNQKLLSLVPLKSHFVIASKYHPFATLLLQSLSAIILAVEGLFKFTPHIFIDTTGPSTSYIHLFDSVQGEKERKRERERLQSIKNS